MTKDTYLTKGILSFFFHKVKFVSDVVFLLSSGSTFNYLQFLSPPFPAFIQSLIIYYMRVTTSEANQKHTEEKVPSFKLESGPFRGGGGMCTESCIMSRSLLG